MIIFASAQYSNAHSSFVIFYHCDETVFVGANLSYEKSKNSIGTNFTEDSRDLSSFQVQNFQDSCFSANPSEECECSLADPLARFDPVCINGLSSGLSNESPYPRDPGDSQDFRDWDWDLGLISKIRDLGFILEIWDLELGFGIYFQNRGFGIGIRDLVFYPNPGKSFF